MARKFKTKEQIFTQAERLSESNWRRKNIWGSGAQSNFAKQSRDNSITKAEKNALKQRGLSLTNG